MSPAVSVAANLSPTTRQAIGMGVVARTAPISHIAATHQVSRKFVYQQGDKAQQALDESFVPSQRGHFNVLFGLIEATLTPGAIRIAVITIVKKG